MEFAGKFVCPWPLRVVAGRFETKGTVFFLGTKSFMTKLGLELSVRPTWAGAFLGFAFSLPEFLDFKLVGKIILVVYKSNVLDLFGPVHSGSEFWGTCWKLN